MNPNYKKIRFIINPKSGKRKKNNIEKYIAQHLSLQKVDYEILFTKHSNHATTLSKEAALLKYDLVIAVGGDGTINEIAKGIVGSDTALGIIPSGSGNGYSRHLKIPQEIDEALLNIFNYESKYVDTLKINDEFFLSVAGIGFDAHIAKMFADSQKRGFWSYAKLVIKEFFSYKSEKYEIFVDGKQMLKEAFLLSFAKSSQYGNNIIISPKARLDDGCFNLAILKHPPLLAIFDIFIKLKNGSIHKSRYYETYSCKEVIIKKKDINAHLDGEPLSFNDLIKIQVYPKSLKVLMPF
jgi:diacylglycerol kinase (ATP)